MLLLLPLCGPTLDLKVRPKVVIRLRLLDLRGLASLGALVFGRAGQRCTFVRRFLHTKLIFIWPRGFWSCEWDLGLGNIAHPRRDLEVLRTNVPHVLFPHSLESVLRSRYVACSAGLRSGSPTLVLLVEEADVVPPQRACKIGARDLQLLES